MISEETIKEIQEAFHKNTKFGNLLIVASTEDILGIIRDRIKEMSRDELEQTAEIFLMLYSIQAMELGRSNGDSKAIKGLIQFAMKVESIKELAQLAIGAYMKAALEAK